MAADTSPARLEPTWTHEDLLSVLGKLSSVDLTRFLKATYPDEPLETWTRLALLELSLTLLQTWEVAAATPVDFLVQATRSLWRASFEAFVRLFWNEVPVAQPLLWNWHMGVYCSEISRVATPIFEGIPSPHDIICNVSPGSSKPVWEEMPVLMGDGTYKPLRDIVVGDRVIGKSDKPCRVTAVHQQGLLPCVSIKTVGEREVVAAPDHPILTACGWMNAGTIVPVRHVLAMVGKSGWEHSWGHVKSVSDAGERPCRCLTVEGDESFVVDGVVVHNSSVWSVLLPCWAWANMPEARIITGSHTDILVTDLAAYSRDVMKGNTYRLLYPAVELTEVQDSKGYYRNTRGGERFTCTVAGKSPTGHHAHYVNFDDPFDPMKILS